MTSYWDYLKRDFTGNLLTTGPAAFLHALYDKSYDESHGASRYWLSKLPVFSTVRKLRDAAQEAQDYYDNTGKDPAYINRINGPGFERLYGDVAASAGAVGMARSLANVYSPEITENLGMKPNSGYR